MKTILRGDIFVRYLSSPKWGGKFNRDICKKSTHKNNLQDNIACNASCAKSTVCKPHIKCWRKILYITIFTLTIGVNLVQLMRNVHHLLCVFFDLINLSYFSLNSVLCLMRYMWLIIMFKMLLRNTFQNLNLSSQAI